MSDDFDPGAEDARLLAEWQAGPGARPTAADRERLMKAAREGRLARGGVIPLGSSVVITFDDDCPAAIVPKPQR